MIDTHVHAYSQLYRFSCKIQHRRSAAYMNQFVLTLN